MADQSDAAGAAAAPLSDSAPPRRIMTVDGMGDRLTLVERVGRLAFPLPISVTRDEALTLAATIVACPDQSPVALVQLAMALLDADARLRVQEVRQ